MTESVALAIRSSRREAAALHVELRRGLGSLAVVVSVAPLPGRLATVYGIPASFVGCGGEKWGCLAAVIYRVCDAMWFTPAGLAAGVAALWIRQWLDAWAEELLFEMNSGGVEMVERALTRGIQV